MTKEQIFQDIYDILKGVALPESQTDDYSEISRKHTKEAIKNFKAYIKNKDMEWGRDYIKLGTKKPLIIKLIK